MEPVAVAQSSSDSSAKRYLFPVLWMISLWCIYSDLASAVINEQPVTLCQSSDKTQDCHCCVRKPRWVFPAVMDHTSNASNTDAFPASLPHVRMPLDTGLGFCALVE